MRKPGGAMMVTVLLAVLSMSAFADDTSIPVSAYRKYVWSARDAYQRRDFAEAQRLLKAYQKAGSPGDPMLEAAGCDPGLEVRLLSAALETARACMSRRAASAHWTSDQLEPTEGVVVNALKTGDRAALEPYLECAVEDVTERASFCHTPVYPTLRHFERFMAAVQSTPGALDKFEWRDIHVTRDSPSQLRPSAGDFKEQGFTAVDDGGQRWVLYSASPQWKPCGMTGVPLLTLRQDKTGQIRIGGFAASCLDVQP